MIAQRLRALDNRVLGKRIARLRTEPGWRKNVARWRLVAAAALLELGLAFVSLLLDDGSLVAFAFVGAVMAFQAGMLKAEDDRLHGRGMYRYLPPGL